MMDVAMMDMEINIKTIQAQLHSRIDESKFKILINCLYFAFNYVVIQIIQTRNLLAIKQ